MSSTIVGHNLSRNRQETGLGDPPGSTPQSSSMKYRSKAKLPSSCLPPQPLSKSAHEDDHEHHTSFESSYPFEMCEPTPLREGPNPQLQMQSSPPSAPVMDTERSKSRLEFALLVKILLKILWREDELELYHQVKASIRYCTSRSRMGDPSFEPLENILEANLWFLVGDGYWNRAMNLREQYLQRRCKPETIHSHSQETQTAIGNSRTLSTSQKGPPSMNKKGHVSIPHFEV